MSLQAANRRTDNSEQTTRKLSDDIGVMADRIGEMADRIGVMADRILETQRIQSENLNNTQATMREMMDVMQEHNQTNQRILALLIQREVDFDPSA